MWRRVDRQLGPEGPAITASIGSNGVAGSRNIGTSRNPEACELHASEEGRFDINEKGRMAGWFIVPAEGYCSQQEKTDAVVPGRYFVEFSYHLTAGSFRVVQ